MADALSQMDVASATKEDLEDLKEHVKHKLNVAEEWIKRISPPGFLEQWPPGRVACGVRVPRLTREPGVADTARFIRQFTTGSGDFTKERRERFYEQTKDMTKEARITFHRKKAQELRRQLDEQNENEKDSRSVT